MKTLTIAKAWDHITPEVTTSYPAGSFEVTDAIHAAALQAGVITEEKTDGRGASEAGAKVDPGKAEK